MRAPPLRPASWQTVPRRPAVVWPAAAARPLGTPLRPAAAWPLAAALWLAAVWALAGASPARAGGQEPREIVGEGPGGPGGPQSRLPQPASVVTRVDSTGAESPYVRVALPYRSLVFAQGEGGFRAGARVVVVAVRDGQRVGGGVGEATAVVPDYAATRGDGQLVCDAPLLVRGEAPAELQVTVQVLETSRHWEERLLWTPGAGRSVPVYFTDLRWDLAAGPGGTAWLDAGRDSLRLDIGLARRSRVEAWPAGGVSLAVRIAPIRAGRPGRRDEEEDGGAVVRRLLLDPRPVGVPAWSQRLAIPAAGLPFGRLALAVWLDSGEGSAAEHLAFDPSRPFVNLSWDWRDDEEWARQVSWLEGIAEREQRQNLQRLPADRRAEAWRELWEAAARQSGAPADDLRRTHAMRIVDADQQFGDFGRGALSDRGRVYIRYGAPDSVEHRADDLSFEGRWEIWYYHEERLMFTFYDAHGLGDYRLASTGTY